MRKYLPLILSVLVISVFCFTLFHNTQNIPSFDDYDATLAFIGNFCLEKRPLLGKLKVLFGFHNEHCILVSRVSALIYYHIFQEINFAHLVFYQNTFLLGFFGIVLAVMKQYGVLSSYSVLFVTFFLFGLSFWQVSFFYWAGIQHYTVFFFSFLSLFLLSKSEKSLSGHFFFAVVCVFFAVFSFGNGLITLFLGAWLLFARKQYPSMILWSIISLGLFTVTFFFRIPAETSGEAFNVEWMARLLFTFLGSFLFVNPSGTLWYQANVVLCMLAGVAIFVFWVGLFFKGYALKNPLLYVLFSLPVITGILIAISRFSSKAAGGIAPRYMFFTATIPVLLLLILLDLKLITRRKLQYLAAIGMVVWMTSFYNNLITLKTLNNHLMTEVRHWEENGHTSLINDGNGRDYAQRLDWALKNRVIRIPEK